MRDKTGTVVNLVVTFVATMLIAGATAAQALPAAGPARKTSDPERESTAIIAPLKGLDTAADHVVLGQLTILDRALNRLDHLLGSISAQNETVAAAGNRWVGNMNAESHAAFVRAVSEAAARGADACDAYLAGGDEVSGAIDTLHADIDARTKELDKARIHSKYVIDAAKDTSKRIQDQVGLISTSLGDAGNVTEQSLSPELRAKLFKLRVDYEEQKLIDQLWSGTQKVIEANLGFLKTAEEDLTTIGQQSQLINYQVGSTRRVFANIGAVQKAGIQAQLVTQAYGKSTKLRAGLSEALSHLGGFGQSGELGELVRQASSLPQPLEAKGSDRRARARERAMSSDLLTWVRSLRGIAPRVEATEAAATGDLR